jgi:hypothetical protein
MESIASVGSQMEDGEILETAREVNKTCGFEQYADIYPEWVRKVLVEDLKYEGPSKV